MTTPKQPTEAEINEAANDHMMAANLPLDGENDYIMGFNAAIYWLQNYQTQQPIKQVRSAEEILMPYVQRPDGAPDYVFLFHALQAMREHASQFQTPANGASEGSQFENENFIKFVKDSNERIENLKQAINQDKTGLAKGLEAVYNLTKSYTWITEGRGPYAYDDDRYKGEVLNMINEIAEVSLTALRESGALADKAFHGLFEGQSSQPQPNAISVIEAYRDQLQESSKYFELDDWDDQSNIIKAQINLLETILNQVK